MSELNSSKLSIYCNLGEGSIPMRHVHTHFTEQNNDQPRLPGMCTDDTYYVREQSFNWQFSVNSTAPWLKLNQCQLAVDTTAIELLVRYQEFQMNQFTLKIA